MDLEGRSIWHHSRTRPSPATQSCLESSLHLTSVYPWTHYLLHAIPSNLGLIIRPSCVDSRELHVRYDFPHWDILR